MNGATIFRLLFAIVTIHSCHSATRTLRSWINPGCGALCKEKNYTTVYLRADSENDTLHYLWDFSIGKPSVLLAITPLSAWMNITWPDYVAGREHSVTFSEEPTYTFGIVMQKIIEFNDVNDTALIDTDDASNTNLLRPECFSWRRKAVSQHSDLVGLDMEGNSYNDRAKNISRYGSIRLSLLGFSTFDHADLVPHILHSENSTQIDMIFNHLQTNSSFVNSRFAVEFLLVDGGSGPDGETTVDVRKTLDDEHTPGIFEIVELSSNSLKTKKNSGSLGAHMRWRPVSYTSHKRDISDSTVSVHYPITKVDEPAESLRDSMLYSYYGNDSHSLLVERLLVSFGSKSDGFYKKNSYATWTFIVGYGDPPEERFSSLVIMIISIGLGLPVLIMLVVGIYFCIRRMPKRQSEVLDNR